MVSQDSEEFNGDSVLLSEEKIKKAERILFNIIQFCNRVSARHEPVKDPKVFEEFKKYEILNNVNLNKIKLIIIYYIYFKNFDRKSNCFMIIIEIEQMETMAFLAVSTHLTIF